MNPGLDKLVLEMKPFHNHICIVHDLRLVRFIGIAEDEQDYYYICTELGGKVGYYSAVGWCQTLKNHYPEDAYKRIDNLFKLNGSQPVDNFETKVL